MRLQPINLPPKPQPSNSHNESWSPFAALAGLWSPVTHTRASWISLRARPPSDSMFVGYLKRVQWGETKSECPSKSSDVSAMMKKQEPKLNGTELSVFLVWVQNSSHEYFLYTYSIDLILLWALGLNFATCTSPSVKFLLWCRTDQLCMQESKMVVSQHNHTVVPNLWRFSDYI